MRIIVFTGAAAERGRLSFFFLFFSFLFCWCWGVGVGSSIRTGCGSVAISSRAERTNRPDSLPQPYAIFLCLYIVLRCICNLYHVEIEDDLSSCFRRFFLSSLCSSPPLPSLEGLDTPFSSFSGVMVCFMIGKLEKKLEKRGGKEEEGVRETSKQRRFWREWTDWDRCPASRVWRRQGS